MTRRERAEMQHVLGNRATRTQQADGEMNASLHETVRFEGLLDIVGSS